MRRALLLASLMWPSLLGAQTAPIFLGATATMLPPTVDASGRTIVLGSAIAPEGANLGAADLYAIATDGSGLRRLTRLSGTKIPPQGANAVSLSGNGSRAAFTIVGPTSLTPPGTTGSIEEVHIIDVASGAERVVAVDTQDCIRPLAPVCIACFFTCVNNPHISGDGTKVLYAVSRGQPFHVVNADGTGLTRLPVVSGAIAPAPQRVIARNGLTVFTSSAPFPTVILVVSAVDVWVMNLDGTNVQNVTKFGFNASLFTANATISADGGAVAFESNRDPDTGAAGQTTRIWTARTDGGGLRALTTGSDASSQPSISGDGSLVAFVRNGQIGVVRSDGAGLKMLTNFRMSVARDPVISDDGSVIVFAIGPRNGGIGAIYAINSDGSNLRPVYAPRVLNQNGVTGIMLGAAPSPGSLISAFGLNLSADSITAAVGFPLPPSLAGLSLLVNGLPAPLLAVTPWQVNAQLPADINPGPVAFQLRFAEGTSPPAAAADVKNIAPVIFLLPPAGNIAPPLAAAFHAGSAVPADQAHPASAGEVLAIYGTGLGWTDPFVSAGAPAPASPPARTLVTPQVLIGNIPAQVLFSGLTPGLAGVYQVNAVVPAGLRPGPQTIVWKIDSATSSNPGMIVVQ